MVIKYGGYIFFGFMFVFAISLANERIINSDAAFYLFKLINFEHFNIEHGRYSAIISQLIILPFIKLGVSLKALVVIYSVSFVLLFFLVFLVILHGLKDESAALCLMLLLVVGLSHPMYRPVSESTQGLVYSILLAGILWYPGFNNNDKRRNNTIQLTLSTLVIILCFFSHPITVFPLAFIVGFYILDRHKLGSFIPWTLILVILILFGIKSISGGSSGYESEKLNQLSEIKQNLVNFSEIYSTKFLHKKISSTYLIPLILLVLLNLYYLMEKKWLKLILLDAFCTGFIVIHNLVFLIGSDIELEKNFMTANFIILFAFSKDLYPWSRGQGLKILFLALILGWSAKIILEPVNIYKDRIRYYKTLDDYLQMHEGTKFYTTENQIDNSKILFMWGVGFESLLISALDGPEEVKTIYPFKESTDLPDYINDPNLYLCVHFWPRWDIHSLNRKYFQLPQEKYKKINLPEKLK